MKKLLLFSVCVCMVIGWVSADEPLYRVLVDGKWGAISSNGELVVEPEHDYLFPFVNGIAVVRKGSYRDGKRAYMEADGTLLTGFDFDRAYYFFGPLAVVYIDGKEGYIDRDGRSVTKKPYTYAEDFRGEYALVREGSWSEGAWGAVDSEGKLSIPLAYDWLGHTSDPGTFIYRSEGAHGLIDGTGKVITPALYENLYSSGEYLVGVQRAEGLAHYLILSVDGAVMFQPADDALQIRSISNGYATIYSSGKHGLVRIDGTRLIEPRFDALYIITEDLVATGAGAGRNRRYGIMEATGREIVSPQLEWVPFFGDGDLAIIRQEARLGFLNQAGQVVVEPQYDSVRPFTEGMAAVQKDGRWGFINEYGETVIDFEFDWVYDFSEGLAVFRVGEWDGGKRGYINRQGEVVIEARFDWAYSFENGVAHVAFGRHYDGTFGYIDTTGKYIWEPTN